MSWNKKTSQQILIPIPPSYIKWTITLGLTLFFLFYSLYSNYQKEISDRERIINIIISISPFIITLILFFIQIFFYFKSKMNYEFLENEKRYADKKWEEWGLRGISILDLVILLPNKITLPYILKYQSLHVANYQLPKHIDYLPEDKSPCFILLRTLQDKIREISKKHPFSIHYLTNQDLTASKKEFEYSWKILFDESPQINVNFTHTLDYSHIEDTVRNNEDLIQLILIEQAHNKNQSAAFTAFIFTADEVAFAHQLNAIANVKRPMPITMDEDKQKAIHLFSEIQTKSKNSTICFSDNKCQSDLLAALFSSNDKFPKIKPNKLLNLEFFIGPLGEFSSWLNLAVAIDYVSKFKNTTLVISQNNQSMFIGTITSSPSI
ncbi:hypothetical protein [Moellerella wisconsensis]|uniref:hypothetical protein n=1 Tax=Moellerella wisconsensis TaxID=158849 RepID=UPI000640C2EE|nr:hypothetical protein [Moellerella wisconsensis]KLN95585.1 hypothetical protein VK86_14530 [Moellerella wisconsensis]